MAWDPNIEKSRLGMSADSFIAIKNELFCVAKSPFKGLLLLGIYFCFNKVSTTIDQRISNKTYPSMIRKLRI